MSNVDRIARVSEMIRRELALSVYHIGLGDPTDTGAISFVSVELSRDLRSASVFVSLMPTGEITTEELMKWLRRHRVDFQRVIADKVSLKYTPKLFFKQTLSIEKGDNVLHLLNELEQADEAVEETSEDEE
ncbi:MAG: 30S ribosome-binding factor RbfA [Kiritimatiellae bacterium]|jgi:ribosome-binding factor A|nr:30S ribosome-binding factor RbfA [Kiritimatiellia bacterium]MBQ2281625.1 30S ribosome-binding factor RbfA [Kiritimatiellia bacterium]